MKLNNLNISTKLWLAVSALIFALVAMITILSWRAGVAQNKVDVTFDINNAKIRTATQWYAYSAVILARTQAGIVGNNPELDAFLKPQNDADVAKVHDLQKSLEAMPLSEEDRKGLDKIANERQALFALMAQTTTMTKAGDSAGIKALFDRSIKPAADNYLRSLHDFVLLQESKSETMRAEFAEVRRGNVKIALTLLLFVIGGAVTGAAILIRSVREPLIAAVKLANRIAQGDLAEVAAANRQDELGNMMNALKAMNDSLVKIVGEVRSGTDAIATASSEIATGNMDLSSRTEQQAGSLEETASSMEELTSTVKQNADNARQASQLAASASEIAVKGGTVVSQVVDTMGAINDSSKKIVDIIGVIDSIAFQTNILALNAAVEAARAGEEGRGFAVVASEVRSLAQRSAAAAKEIKALIDDSVVKVDTGSRLVDQAGSTMGEIVSSIKRVTDIMGEISSANQEQSEGIEQVHQAIIQMDQMTQQNAALVEEAAAASGAMQDQAGRLAQLVSVFKLDGVQASAAVAIRVANVAPVKPAAAPVAKKARAQRLALKSPAQAKKIQSTAQSGDGWEEF